MSTSTYYLAMIAFAVLAGIKPAIAVIRWYNARLGVKARLEVYDGIKDTFIADMANNHLRHIYDAQNQMKDGLNMILEHIGSSHRIDFPEPPPIRWLPYDPSKK